MNASNNVEPYSDDNTHNGDPYLLRLGRIEGKLDSFIKQDEARLEAQKSIENRVVTLEKQRSWIMGAATTVAAGVSIGWHLFQDFLRK